jgi:UDP-2-acetamido-3-amino-2,3-dideoxy-glucuronate N-acetyltransferase
MKASSKKKFFCHRLGLAESEAIGEGTRVWAWAHVMAGARVGSGCNIGEHCFVEKGAVIGNDVVIKNGVAIWDGVQLGDRVFVGPNAVFTNDMAPRSKVFRDIVHTRVAEGASIGANATLLSGIEIGEYAFVAAGAVVTRSVPAFTLVMGNPARPSGHVCRCGERLRPVRGAAKCKCGQQYRLDPKSGGLRTVAASAAAKKAGR